MLTFHLRLNRMMKKSNLTMEGYRTSRKTRWKNRIGLLPIERVRWILVDMRFVHGSIFRGVKTDGFPVHQNWGIADFSSVLHQGVISDSTVMNRSGFALVTKRTGRPSGADYFIEHYKSAAPPELFIVIKEYRIRSFIPLEHVAKT
jgi:hypothetical protein